jgi:hypothetical protein
MPGDRATEPKLEDPCMVRRTAEQSRRSSPNRHTDGASLGIALAVRSRDGTIGELAAKSHPERPTFDDSPHRKTPPVA